MNSKPTKNKDQGDKYVELKDSKDLENPKGQNFFDKMKTTIKGAGSSVIDSTKGAYQKADEMTTATINAAKYMPYIVALCAVGAIFFMLAMFYLPMSLLVPHKFSLSFAIACACFLGAVGLLKGDPDKFLKSFLAADKIKYTAAYAVCFVGTFMFSLAIKNSVLCLLFAFGQVVTSAYLIAISVPGGWKIIELCKVFGKNFLSCFYEQCLKKRVTG
jgi:Got1/Sft2-like family